MSKHKGPKFRSGFQNLLFLSERGGVWKTTTAALVIDIAINSGAAPAVFEIDDQRLLLELFPERTRLVQVPSTEDMLENDQADIAAFGPVFEAITSSDTTQIVAADVGANSDARFIDAAVSVELDEILAAGQRRTAALVLFDSDDDSILCAARTAERVRIGLPSATIIFCRAMDGGADEPTGAEAKRLKAEIIDPIIAANGMIQVPFMRKSLRQAFKSLKLPHTRFATDGAELMARQNIAPFAIRNAMLQMKIVVGLMAEQTEDLLGFAQEAQESTDGPREAV